MSVVRQVAPGSFEAHRHYYPKALNATIHPMVNFFLNLEPERIVSRYCHLRPTVNAEVMREVLAYKPRYFTWAGADVLNVTNLGGKRQMVVVENNSCPSGQKSMPLTDDHREQGGYRQFVERTFKPQMKGLRVEGALAVLSDKNPMETEGYAAVIADAFGQPVYYVDYNEDTGVERAYFDDGVLYVRPDEATEPVRIRAAFRYVTQRPWSRIPLQTRTRIINPVVACLAGGRNKMVAAKAYQFYNAELEGSGLRINTPETFWDVSKNEVPLWVDRLGGQAVVKVPYSNAGQGVYTIVSPEELEAFMQLDFPYDLFIVQSLIGNSKWSSVTPSGRLYHVGTIPNVRNQTYVADIRVMVSATENGIRPLCTYARRAHAPLADALTHSDDSWQMLGTNLSYRAPDGSWTTEANRLVLMDRRDFNRLGLGLDDLIEAYVQTVLSTVAIDKMAQQLMSKQGRFRQKLFRSLNADDALLDELLLA